MPPACGVKSRCGVHNLQQTVRSAAIPQVVAVDLRGKNFASSGSFTETAALSFSGRRLADSARVDSQQAETPPTGGLRHDLRAKSTLFKTT